MTKLMDQILSSRTDVTGYAVKPYMAMSGRPEYFQRVYIPTQPAPVVDTALHATALVGMDVPKAPASYTAVQPLEFSTGAPKLRGNGAGVMGGAR